MDRRQRQDGFKLALCGARPSGPHLVELARHSNAVHEAFLSLTGRLEDARPRIEMSAALIQEGLNLLTGKD